MQVASAVRTCVSWPSCEKGANLAGSRHAPTPMGPGDEPRGDGGVCISPRLSGATGRGSGSIISSRCPPRANELVVTHVVCHLFAPGAQFLVERRPTVGIGTSSCGGRTVHDLAILRYP